MPSTAPNPTATASKRPPRHLSPASRRLWSSVVADFALEADPAALRLLTLACEASDRAEQARKLLDAEGIVVTSARGDRRPHPAVAIERDARIATARLLRELGLEGLADGPETRLPRRGDGALS